MRNDDASHYEFDFLVIGGGIAGLMFALKAAAAGTVAVIVKAGSADANTSFAQGGIASVWSPSDSFEAHIADTLRAGAGLCNRAAVETIVRDGPAAVRDLIELGTRFTSRAGGADSDYDLGREGGHSHRRVLHSQDLTGREIMRALSEAVAQNSRITVFEKHLGVNLLLHRAGSDSPVCWGAYVLDRETCRIKTFVARATILATGGAGKVYLYTSNPDVSTGDGVAMAWRAGATIANMEFFQFHPTCLYHPAARSFLISEALRGEGAKLRLPNGETFMERYHPDAELAPRDIVARAIDAEMKRLGIDHVYLDISHRPAAYVRDRFPNIYQRCLSLGIDITQQPIPVVPAAHYMCGGVVTDLEGRTSVSGLYAAGEVAMTGLHGANRLASNSLLEAAVMARRAAISASREIAARARHRPPPFPPWDPGRAIANDERVLISQSWDEIRRLMWNYVGIVRSNQRLDRARRRLDLLKEEIRRDYWAHLLDADLVELRNLVTVADLIVRCAAARQESRGLHYNVDYPFTDDAKWLRDTLLPVHTAD